MWLAIYRPAAIDNLKLIRCVERHTPSNVAYSYSTKFLDSVWHRHKEDTESSAGRAL